ncbi:aldehyde dehydrogenase family protein [Natrinema gelatinilyticum]|uniref:aldehyde dehydrogenase family protein n=1 Tax=Natrinema gelatinilyticum TaxID=2961571 RepID=UPI0020C505B9|nr:aldehyde dehydrogenase family protein [Natrinema gelatinilyticum]
MLTDPSVPSHEANYIGGEWTAPDDAGFIESRNPSVPDEVVSEFPSSPREVAREAIDVAVAAQDEWADMSPHARGGYLRDAAAFVEDKREDVAELIAREMGKPVSIADGEVQRAVDLLNYYAEIARDYGGDAPPSGSENTHAYTEREPLGTVGLITPWNYPIAIPIWKLAPALVAGNTIILKPASSSPAVAAVVAQAFDHAGLPDGVLNFVTGPGSQIGDEITKNDDIDIVSFTGSTEAGMYVYEDTAAEGKRVQCEMGGKNPLIVDDTAGIETAVELTTAGAFAATGQSCTATSRVYVFEEVYDEYLAALTEATEEMVVGDPLDPATEVGPKADEDGFEKVCDYIKLGREEGATLHYGGRVVDPDGVEDGYFVEPTIFTDVDHDMRLMNEEIFGPIVGVMQVSDYEEAVELANDTQYGLSASICTNRLDYAKEFVGDIEAGVVKVNQTTTGIEFQLPFGGMKMSSTETYKEQGRQAIDFFTHEKAVYVTHVMDD